MTNWGTLVQEIAQEAGKSAANDGDDIKLAICDAVRQMQGQEFWWQEAAGNFATSAGIYSYDDKTLGTTQLRRISRFLDNLTVDVAGSTSDRRELVRVTMEEMDRLRDGGGLSITGVPSRWAYHGRPGVYGPVAGQRHASRSIELYPVPDTSTHIVNYRFMAASAPPGRSYSGGVWSFTQPETSVTSGSPAAMNDAYPDSASQEDFWFDPRFGYDMVKWYALHLLFNGRWRGQGGQAERYMSKHLEAIARSKYHTDGKSWPTHIAPWNGRYGLDEPEDGP